MRLTTLERLLVWMSFLAMRQLDWPLTQSWGEPGKTQGTRELITHESYCLVYETSGETVWMLVLVHTERQWPLVRD